MVVVNSLLAKASGSSKREPEIPAGGVRVIIRVKESRVIEDLAAASPGRSAVPAVRGCQMCGTGLLAGSFSMAAGMEGVRQVLLIGLAPVELVRDGEQHEEFIEVARSATGRDADRRAAADARVACPLGDGDHPVAAFPGRSHPGWARSSHPAGWPGTQAPARRSAPACQPGNRTASLLSVHKHVDHLCATAPSLCISSGNAGDSAAWTQPWQGLYLGERESHPVHKEKTGIIHMPRRNR
jgi:hypothetical protein